MRKLNRNNIGTVPKPPIKIIQFGEGNFLRAFVAYAIQKLNEAAAFNAGIAVVQPIDRGLVKLLNTQDGLYTLFMKGVEKGKEIQEKELISTIVKGVDPYAHYGDYLSLAKEAELAFVVSNTTEAGIAYVANDTPDMQPPTSFPAKLTLLLFERYRYFKGAADKGLTIIPCELINHNAETLKEIILRYISDWKLGEGFETWLLHHCSFHNTLVDRIVPGYPKDQIEAYNRQLDYEDQLIVTAETFFLWVIEGNADLKGKLPFHKTNLEVKIVGDMQPYRTRKVRILNGAHTAMVPFSILYGNQTVKESVDNNFTGDFIKKVVFDEIIGTLELDRKQLEDFAEAVFDRFRNPFIKHQLASIALNSISKFKVRVLPSLLQYVSVHAKLPPYLTFALACLLRFYKGTWSGKQLPVNDDPEIGTFFETVWSSNDIATVADTVLARVDFWDEDLTQIKGLVAAIVMALQEMEENGIEKGFANYRAQLKK